MSVRDLKHLFGKAKIIDPTAKTRAVVTLIEHENGSIGIQPAPGVSMSQARMMLTEAVSALNQMLIANEVIMRLAEAQKAAANPPADPPAGARAGTA